MDRSKNDTGLADFEGAIPAGLENMTDEELRTDLWDTPTCQRCLPYFHPELAEPVCNRTESSATRTTRKRVILQGKNCGLPELGTVLDHHLSFLREQSFKRGIKHF